MQNPSFLTFTGADDNTNIGEMISLSNWFNIEWGILISKDRMGTARYPSLHFINTIRQFGPRLRLSLHICGAYSKEIVETGRCKDIEEIAEGFKRIQVNYKEIEDLSNVKSFANRVSISPIVQCRDETVFPPDASVTWLFDKSGGNGIISNKYPLNPKQRLVGFAGGVELNNIKKIINIINNQSFSNDTYWLDMESSLRIDDEFSLATCESICKEVYGIPR